MDTGQGDREAARALLVERGLSVSAADEFLMRSQLTATEAAVVLGVKNSRAARDTLRRWGVKPVGRGPGRTGENTYPADLVWQRQQSRPGRGWRKGRSTTARDDDGNTLHSGNATTTALNAGDPWYSDHREVVDFASVMVDADRLSTPSDVVYFFEKPWKWDPDFAVWAAAGRPVGPSPDDLVQARQLGDGTMRRELERRYHDDSARWDAFIETLDASEAGQVFDDEDPAAAVRPTSNVLSLEAARESRGKR